MKIYAGSRRSGKTCKLIRDCAAEDGRIVVATASSVGRVLDEAEKLGVKIRCPLTYDEFRRGAYSTDPQPKLFIDDVDGLLAYLAVGAEIVAATANSYDIFERDCFRDDL